RLEAQGAAAPQAPAAALPGDPAPAQPAVNAQLTPAEPVVAPAPAAADTAPQDAAAEASASEEPGMLDQLLGNPLLLGLIAGSAFLVLLLLLLLLARKRKAQQEAEKHLRMARALAEDGERGPDLDLPPSSFEGLDVSAPNVTLSPAVVAASATAAVAAEKPAAPADVVAPAADPRAALLAEVDESLARGRLNHAADLLEAAVASEPQRSDLRLKLMEVYARQGDQDAFAGQERKLAVNDTNQAEVAALKERFPAMLGVAAVAAGAAGAAALAAELDEQYVQDLLQDKELELGESAPELVVEPVVAAEPEPEPVVEEADLDSAFDLSLDDDLPADDHLDMAGLEDLVVEAPEAEAAPAVAETDADDDFEALLAQAQATPQNVDDLAEFDLDVAEDPVAPTGSEEAPVDVAAELAAFEAIPEFDPISELELPDDFDLSLSLDDDSPAAKNFASELDDVNAELDKLSQNLETPSVAQPSFTAEDAALEPEPLDDLDFDFFSGADEVATKLDLARAYIDMGDHQGARDILDEVVKDGDDSQRQEANEMLSRLV
ncbi:FimV/HubP family polar landmark protein, partial [Pseudomonas soli]|uniref:FimV/HubP family polar landmark protein n=1 Tax=Pseudomonas soli TaxID=1306993 RepID=UPI0028AE27BE